jgi:uncharacterized protein (DUF488 family)
MIIYTIGHSNRSLKEFLELLKKFKIKNLVDVRRFPSSKKFSHFNKECLEEALSKIGINYLHLGNELGGFRKGGYEAYMKTNEFKDSIIKLLKIAKEGKTAVMCSEKLFFKCHRRHIANELVKCGCRVIHIFDENRCYEQKFVQRKLISGRDVEV